MFPDLKKTISISNNIINRWHQEEHQINSFNDALKLIDNKNKDDIYYHVELLSLLNTALWHEEDKARDPDASDECIADVKRKIDKLNSMRVTKVEEIDILLYSQTSFNKNAVLNTETPASVLDRLTILCLKHYHMSIEAERADSSEDIRNKCAQKFHSIKRQLNDLSEAYSVLIAEIHSGKRRYELYGQFKMYNDPELNPVLYNKKNNVN